ncbi:hypothetical protein [Coleofasciculus sp. FACHB-129]|uniref:hypothetical protein n=1 Tax=Coleofasciculus sp. FACHB-129 TaxID=2692785 RepID=UPI001A7E427F|nr:hypothetical protein [Coleofasciculus sp. FACHB-129]
MARSRSLLTRQNYLREDAMSAIALTLIYLFPTLIFFLLQLGFRPAFAGYS